MSGKKYSVGQVVFVFLREKSALLPALVTEEIIRRTVSGNSVSYLVQVGKEPPIEISTIKSEVFASAELARESLIARSIATVNKLVDGAVAKAATIYPAAMFESDPATEVTNDELMVEQSDVQDGAQVVEMPDGTMAKVRVRT